MLRILEVLKEKNLSHQFTGIELLKTLKKRSLLLSSKFVLLNLKIIAVKKRKEADLVKTL